MKSRNFYIRMAITRFTMLKEIAFEHGEMQYVKEYGITVESLKKQLPTKPIIVTYSPALCPCCETQLSELVGDGVYKHWENLKACPECQQLLDWKLKI